MMACATDVVDVDIGVRSKGTFLLAFFCFHGLDPLL